MDVFNEHNPTIQIWLVNWIQFNSNDHSKQVQEFDNEYNNNKYNTYLIMGGISSAVTILVPKLY